MNVVHIGSNLQTIAQLQADKLPMFGRSLSLPSLSDSNAAQSTRDELLSALETGNGVQIDASQVERVSTAMLQVLVSAKATFASAGIAFQVVAPSDAFCQAVRDAALGHSLETLHHEEA